MITHRALFALAKALEGVPILGALRGTPAFRAGLRHGDVLLSVNGMRTRTVFEYIEAKALRQDGMQAVIFRGGAEHVTELLFEDRVVTNPEAILAELVHLRIGVPDGGGSDPTGAS